MCTSYDFIFSIGSACSCTQVLRAAGLQHGTFPFDWITIRDRPADIRFRADLMADDFNDWFTREAMSFRQSPSWHLCDFYRDTKMGITFNHDFPKGVPFDEAFDAARARYDRRIARLFRCIRTSQKVLAVRIDRPDQEYPTTFEDCRYVCKRLSEKFPGVRFEVLLLTCQEGVPFEQRREVSEGDVTQVTFDYKSRAPEAQTYTPDMALLAQYFRERYVVRDYRTKEERHAEQRRVRQARYEKYDANGWLSYRIARLTRQFSDHIRSLGIERLRKNGCKYDHVVPLGMNCEVAFRFFCSWHFVESSLFAWSRVEGLDHLSRVLDNLDELFSGSATLEPRSRMWQCDRTKVYLHGRFRAGKPGSPPPLEEAQKADLQDLRGRVGHLREKFRNYLRDDKSTLFVYRLNESDGVGTSLNERLERLERSLAALGAKNWKLLVICEADALSKMPSGEHRQFRAVRKFNPSNRVTDASLGDKVGWQRIFAEFGPVKVLEQRHRFKFE